MNIYFLIEGQSTEADVYPVWLSYLVPKLMRVECFDEIEQNNYYLFSSYGIPSVEKDIVNAIKDINAINKYNYFVICLDADAATISQREEKIFTLLKEENVELNSKTFLKIIVQNKCIETWFLGNRKVYRKNPQKDKQFIEYSKFYNVCRFDPELMEKPQNYERSISTFHFKYLKAMFRERGNMRYSKSNSKEIQKESYLNELKNRVNDNHQHLFSFSNFLDFCCDIQAKID